MVTVKISLASQTNFICHMQRVNDLSYLELNLGCSGDFMVVLR